MVSKPFFKNIVMLVLETFLFGSAYEYRLDKMFYLNSVSRGYAIFYSIKKLWGSILICKLFVQVLNARDITDLKSSVGHKALFNERNL